MTAVIFDLDGTLCDVSSIKHLIEGEERDFHAFHAASIECPPHDHVVKAARRTRDSGRPVLVVTSREFLWRDLTLDWLVKHEIPYDRLEMRIASDFRADYVVKEEILAGLLADGFEIAEAWEDADNIAELWESKGITVHRP